MGQWVSVRTALPPAGEVVEVIVETGTGSVQAQGYLGPRPAALGPQWRNASTRQPFPSGWTVTLWRQAKPERDADSQERIDTSLATLIWGAA